MYFENFNLTDVVTPVDAGKLQELLEESGYLQNKTSFLVDGFRCGFDLGYAGPCDVKMTSHNLKLRVGNETILWNKIMKEVKNKRYTGPFEKIPFKNYIQSPVGLVPKGEDDTRLIFHLSHPRSGGSVNGSTPKEICSVNYKDFSQAILACLELGISCSLGKSDMKSAFRNLGMKPEQFCYLILKARSPIDNKTYYFVDKCLPFGASISCSHFQKFSDAIAHIVKFKLGLKKEDKIPVNYLDDFLFAALTRALCNRQIDLFIKICDDINFPVALDKTEYGTTIITFLGLLIDTVNQIIVIPVDKVERAKTQILDILSHKKTTVRALQKLCGHLNFLCRCIVPGRAFTRRLYSYFSSKMKPYHHIRVNSEMTKDLSIWFTFLQDPVIYCRPFIDHTTVIAAEDLDWSTDASGKIGFGGIFGQSWFRGDWERDFLRICEPSIEFLELYVVTVSVSLWAAKVQNRRICLNCDNQAVVHMINKSTSSCKQCMQLIRHITLTSLKRNVRVFARYLDTKSNGIADALSRGQMIRFRKLCNLENRTVNQIPEMIPEELWPISKIWMH